MIRKIHSKNKKLTIIISIAFVLIAAAIGTTIWYKVYAFEAKYPLFTFNQSQEPGWWSPGSYKTTPEDIENYEKNKQDPGSSMPLASISAFKGKKGDYGDVCFVMAFYQKGTIDITSTLKEVVNTRDDSMTVKLTGTTQLSMLTPEGKKDYVLHQYDYVTASAIQHGNEYGFIQLSDGYIKITGVCPTADMLPSTEAALSALSLS